MRKADLNTGMIVEVLKGDRYLVMCGSDIIKGRELIRFGGGFMSLEQYTDDLNYKGIPSGFDIVKIYSAGESICHLLETDLCRLHLKLIWERPEPILDETEREYLRAAIDPLKSKVKFICKYTHDGKSEHIRIEFKDNSYIMVLPLFEKGLIYKGMKLYKNYTLEELGV